MSNEEMAPSGMSRRDALRRGAVAGGAVLWVTPVVQNLMLAPAAAQTTSPAVNCPGRMNGGGQFPDSNGQTASHGFELRCGQVGDVTPPSRFELNGEVGGQTFAFHLEFLSVAQCFDDPAYSPGNPAVLIDTFVGEGNGRVSGPAVGGTTVEGYSIEFRLTDQGEPGTNDRIAVKIIAPDGTTTFFQSAGYPALVNVLTGNQQSVPVGHKASCT